jgi:hypothetical protein
MINRPTDHQIDFENECIDEYLDAQEAEERQIYLKKQKQAARAVSKRIKPIGRTR